MGARLFLHAIASAAVLVTVTSCSIGHGSDHGDVRFDHSFGASGLPGVPGRLDQGDRDPDRRNPYDRTARFGLATPDVGERKPAAGESAGAPARTGGTNDRNHLAPGCPSGCSGHDHASDDTAPAEIDPLDDRHYVIAEWTFEGHSGQHITTPNFDVYTTIERRWLRRNAPRFQEAALAHYQHSITDLPPPGRRLETYLFGDRKQWEHFASDMMKSQANAFLRMGRGGFSTRGRAVMYDIGLVDTLAIASHEGWHQYTQATFKDRLPVWMEEGVATWMEGHRLHREEAAIFHPWMNLERYDQLREAFEAQRLWSLEELLETHPTDMLERGNPAGGLDYYAQVWALTHFLLEAEGGRYADGLRSLLRDAAAGSLYNRVQARYGRGNALMFARSNRRPAGSEVFRAYFGDDLERIGREYDEFVELLLLPGTRLTVARGDRPDGIDSDRFAGSPLRGLSGTTGTRSTTTRLEYATDSDWR